MGIHGFFVIICIVSHSSVYEENLMTKCMQKGYDAQKRSPRGQPAHTIIFIVAPTTGCEASTAADSDSSDHNFSVDESRSSSRNEAVHMLRAAPCGPDGNIVPDIAVFVSSCQQEAPCPGRHCRNDRTEEPLIMEALHHDDTAPFM